MTLLDVGRIDKPHGLRGEVVVTLTSTEVSRVARGSVLVAGERELVVLGSKPLQHRWVVDFDGVDRREDAEALAGSVLRAEPLDDDDPDALWAWVSAPAGSDDLLAWQRLLSALEYTDARRSLAAARVGDLRLRAADAPSAEL